MTAIYHKIIEHKMLSNVKLSDLIKPKLPSKIPHHIDTHTLLWDRGGHSTPQAVAMVCMGVN